eukprot:gene8064-1441_t
MIPACNRTYLHTFKYLQSYWQPPSLPATSLPPAYFPATADWSLIGPTADLSTLTACLPVPACLH